MPVGNTALGMMGTLADYINQQRTQNRQSEDDQLEYQKQLIAQLANRPDANPALLGSALHDMAEMAGAKGGRSKLKGGSAGFFGAHQLPISQFLAGIQDGTRPLVGPTMGPDPNAQPPQGQPAQGAPPPGAQGSQTPPAVPASPAQQAPGQNSLQPGASVLQAPVAMPPPSTNGPAEAQGMLSGARDMMQEKGQNPGQPQGPTNPAQLQPPPTSQPAAQVPLPFAQQPYFRSPQEMSAQAAAAAGQKIQAETSAKLEADIAGAKQIAALPPEVQQQLRGLPGVAQQRNVTAHTIKGPIVEYDDGTGNMIRTPSYIETLPGPEGKTRSIDQYGMPLPPNAQPIIDPHKGEKQSTDNQGNVWKIYPDNTVEKIMGPNGESLGKSQQPPQGSVVTIVNPDNNQPSMYRVRGAQATPILLPGGEQGIKPQAGGQVSAQSQQALQGLNVVMGMMPDLQAVIKEIGISNNPMGQKWDLALQNRGMSTGQLEGQLLMMEGVAEAYGLKGLMGGRPNQRLIDIIKVHLPSAGDSTKLAAEKLDNLSKIIPTIKQAIYDAGNPDQGRRNPYQQAGGAQGSSAPPQQGGGVPNPPKTVTASQAKAAAAKAGVPEDTFRNHLITQGYAIVKDPTPNASAPAAPPNGR